MKKVFWTATLLIKRLCDRCFPVNFVKFLRTHFLQNTSGRLLLMFPNSTFEPCKTFTEPCKTFTEATFKAFQKKFSEEYTITSF